jgi:hypothetical protein
MRRASLERSPFDSLLTLGVSQCSTTPLFSSSLR